MTLSITSILSKRKSISFFDYTSEKEKKSKIKMKLIVQLFIKFFNRFECLKLLLLFSFFFGFLVTEKLQLKKKNQKNMPSY